MVWTTKKATISCLVERLPQIWKLLETSRKCAGPKPLKRISHYPPGSIEEYKRVYHSSGFWENQTPVTPRAECEPSAKMSEISSLSGIYDLTYPEEESLFTLTPSALSPIDYEWDTLIRDEISLSSRLGAYSMLYIFKSETEESGSTLLVGNTSLHLSEQESPWAGIEGTLQSDMGSSFYEANHPGPPWFH